MPWDMDDYPSSLKNLDTTVRKKAIEIANAMIDEGYDEGRAIPIATEQAKEWHEKASKSEIDQIRNMSDNSLRSSDNKAESSGPELMEKGEHVVAHEKGWAVKSEDAMRASNVFENKEEAVQRAEEIAKNKGTKMIIHKKDGSIQNHTSYDK
ncbi:DUF2188 domain-containing protein [Halobacillus seohaensis]|uniref:DUF2188 domain-containing protein n=1 Tax=Halobacillus seohaensis TaxID=447421 RepID=A0ABW2ELU5_9BACI